MSEEIRIEFTRFSAFYSPLIATMAGGFLKEEGLTGKHSVSAPGKSAIAGLLDGSVHVAQSAPSQGFTPLEQGKTRRRCTSPRSTRRTASSSPAAAPTRPSPGTS